MNSEKYFNQSEKSQAELFVSLPGDMDLKTAKIVTVYQKSSFGHEKEILGFSLSKGIKRVLNIMFFGTSVAITY